MDTIQTKQLNGNGFSINGEDIEAFKNKVRGDLITPNSESYDQDRSVWNGLIDKRPALIIRCLSTGDVVDAVNFAREHELLVSIRGGGHNVAGNAVFDGWMAIDLSAMGGIHVDPKALVARVQLGDDWGDLDTETQLRGQVTPGGEVSMPPVAGLTLGGG